MSDNPLVKFRRRNSPQENEQDPQQRQENKYNKIQRNDLHAYVQQPKISRNRDERNEDQQEYHQEEEEDNSQEKFGGFVFTKSKGDQKKQQQQYVYEPKVKQQGQQQRRDYPQKRDQPPKRKPEKKNSKGSSQQMKEPSKQQLTELEKLQQHLLNCGLAISNQDNQESESILPIDLGKLPLPSQQMVAPPPGLAEKDKSTDFADLLNKFHDDDSDGQLNYEEHFSSSVLPRGTFSQPQGINQFNNNPNINNFQSQADQKQKEKKKKNKKKKPKNKNQPDLNIINNPPDFYNPNQNSNEFFDPFKATPFSFPQQQMGLNNLPEPLNISGPTLTTPLSFPPQGMMGLGPQIAPFNSNIMGAPPQLGFPLGPNLGMDSMDAPFPMGPNLGSMGPLGMPQMPPPKFNQMPMPPQVPTNHPHQPRKKQQMKQQQHMMMPPNFDPQLYCPPMMPNHMQNQFQDFQPQGQPFPPNLMSSGPLLGMPSMMPFDNNFDQDWMNSDGMLQMPTPIQMFSNQTFPNLSQVQHPDSYHDDNNYVPLKQTEEKQEEYQGPKLTGEGQPKQRKKLNLNSKPFYPANM